jgi:phenylalanyl-tRNA synthetase beta chain
MKISYNWLKQYIPVDLPPDELADILTNIGLEVESVETFEPVKGGLEGVVIGCVLTCLKHPNANKLWLTTVDVGGEEPLKIVCGASNVKPGQKVPVATAGATLYPGGEAFVIKKSKIRGELSEGMICAEDELGLGTSHDGIMVLDPSAETGSEAASYFRIETDTVFEIGLTPNRIDAASHLGVARDLAAWFSQRKGPGVTWPLLEDFSIDNCDLPVSVEIEESGGCKRYSGITLSGVTVGESPGWLQSRLRSVGLVPINNIVDITNFVLYECGQPLHAFDADRIKGRKVIVKTLPEGTTFTTLDGVERTLLASDLMICNSGEGMCIAGVFGGIHSGITGTTGDIFLESACFDPVYVRRTARHHDLNTDASYRFERGSDPNLTVWALKRAAMLIREIAGGKISSDLVDVYPEPVKDLMVEILYSNINRLIGNPIKPDTIRSIVESLDMVVEVQNEKGMLLRIPPYRVDVQREADVIEEVLRIYGFNRVEIGNVLHSTLSYTEEPDMEKVVNLVAEHLTSNGFYEIKSNSLTRAAYFETGGEPDPAVVRILNPLSQDLSCMRRSLLNGGLEAISYNINRKNPDLKLYEFGYCYSQLPEPESNELLDRFRESHHLGLFITGKTTPANWARPVQSASFPYHKGMVDSCLLKTGIDPMNLTTVRGTQSAYAEGMVYMLGRDPLVEFGRVAQSLLEQFDIKQDVFAAEFNWDLLPGILENHRILFRPLSRFQPVTRDFSLLLDRGVTFEVIRRLAFKVEQRLLQRVTLFDVYEGERIEKGKKSYALTFTLLDEEKTLTDKQIDKTMLNLAHAFEMELGAQVRGMNEK